MKQFTRIEPTTVQPVGGRYKKTVVVKNFRDDEGTQHEFTTFGAEGDRNGSVVAITPDKEVITTYQFRSGPERWMYELPGGGFNDGEDEQTAAMRELKEETGYVSDDITYLGASSRDAYVNATWHYFLALNCRLSEDGRELDEEELAQGAEVRLISIEQLIENAKTDQMTDAVAVLMAYEKLKEVSDGK